MRDARDFSGDDLLGDFAEKTAPYFLSIDRSFRESTEGSISAIANRTNTEIRNKTNNN
jgi:hypothetical protein